MSFDIYVIVPASSWPTARQLDDALVSMSYPVRLGTRSPSAWEKSLAPVPAEPIRFIVQNADHAKALGQPVGAQVEMPYEIAMPVVFGGVTLEPDFGMEAVADAEALSFEIGGLVDGPTAEV